MDTVLKTSDEWSTLMNIEVMDLMVGIVVI